MQNSSEFCFLLFFIHIVIRRFTLIPNITFSVLKTRFFMDKISKYWKELEKSKGGGRIRPFLRPMLELIYLYRVWIRDCSWSLFSTLFRENGHSIFSCLGSPPGIMKKKFLLPQVKTRCTCRVMGADYEYHNKSSQNSFIPYIVLTTLLAPLLLVGPLTKFILVNISWKISCLTQNFALSTNLDFLRQKNLICKRKGRFRGPNWPVWLYRFSSLDNFSWS
jgi:hypothetical protein